MKRVPGARKINGSWHLWFGYVNKAGNGGNRRGISSTTKSVPKLPVTRHSWTKPGKPKEVYGRDITEDHQGRKIKEWDQVIGESRLLNAEKALRVRGGPVTEGPLRGGHTTTPLGNRDEILNDGLTVGPQSRATTHRNQVIPRQALAIPVLVLN